jgi:CBS domain-containing protein
MAVPRTIAVKELMTRDAKTVGPNDTLDVAAKLMWDRDCGCLPVINGDGGVVAMLTDRDICMAAYSQGAPLATIRVATAMSKEVHACREQDTLVAAERIMRERRIRRLPVVATDGRLVGILSLNDIAREAAREHVPPTREASAEGLTQTLAAICEPRAGAGAGAAA